MADMTEADVNKFKDVVNAKKYKEQAVFFLNAFWPEISKGEGAFKPFDPEGNTSKDIWTPLKGESCAEQVWKFTHKFIELDKKKTDGCSLDEFEAHKFLESLGETLTVIAMRERLRKIDLDSDQKMALMEYFVFKFGFKVKTLLDRPQGTNEELIAAQNALEAVQAEIDKIEKEKTRLEVNSLQDGVKGNTAKAELAKLLGQDQLPLNRAIITAEAAVRKAAKTGSQDSLGKIWWMEREIAEAKKYKPKSKQ